jgi:thioredoxin-like negative regulator of GroEL
MSVMSNVLGGMALSVVATIGIDAQNGATAIHWHTGLDEAAAVARETGRPMLIDFWADWCAACNAMDAQVYPDGRVILAMSRIVAVRIDADRKTDLMRRFRVEGLPTLVYTDSHGNELYRFVGVLNASDMAQLLTELPVDIERINSLGRRIVRGEADFATFGALGDELRAVQLYRSSNEYYTRALRARGARQETARRGAITLAMGANHLELREYAAAIGVFERYLDEHPSPDAEAPRARAAATPDDIEARRGEAMLGLAHAWLGQGRTDKARPVLERLVRQHVTGSAHDEATRLLSSP